MHPIAPSRCILSLFLVISGCVSNTPSDDTTGQTMPNAMSVKAQGEANNRTLDGSQRRTKMPVSATRTKPSDRQPSEMSLDALLRILPTAILDETKFLRLLPSESDLLSAMKCADTHPLLELRKRTVSQVTKNIESTRKRVGLGSVSYGGGETVQTQNIKAGEVDKGCTALQNVEVKILKLTMNFMTKNGVQKKTQGRINVIRLGDGPWRLLKM
ncbi:MAG: hypothetical protein VX589_03600 [Myxococcota bacterium]|nr:hypothetical protein [Myxococcota bacterium]